MSFYATWLMIPGILGLMITIYQIMVSLDTSFAGLYAILVSLWVTIFIEAWKRKSSEIASKWGILDVKEHGKRRIREHYEGDEIFSHVTQ